MNDLMVFVYFLCFAAVAGATFAYMYAMMNATLLDYNRSREKQNVHPEMSDVTVSYTHLRAHETR